MNMFRIAHKSTLTCSRKHNRPHLTKLLKIICYIKRQQLLCVL